MQARSSKLANMSLQIFVSVKKQNHIYISIFSFIYFEVPRNDAMVRVLCLAFVFPPLFVRIVFLSRQGNWPTDQN